MDADDRLMAELRLLLGRTLTHQDRPLRVIDVLRQGPVLVLSDSRTGIQADMHGDPRRRVQRTLSLSVLNEHASDLHPTLLELLDGPTIERLRRLTVRPARA